MSDVHHASTRAVYDFSAAHYASVVGTTVTPAFEGPIDRAMLDAFADELRSERAPINATAQVLDGTATAQVLDAGCGTGRVTAYLHERGVDIRGVDLSPNMVEIARAAHPDVRFDIGSLTELPATTQSLRGAVLWYSIIHTPPAGLSTVWNELARVLAPAGALLLGFQAGDNESVERPNAYGSSATLTSYRHRIDDVAKSLEAGGFDVRAQVWRRAELAHETTPQAFLLAQRNDVRTRST